MKAKASLKASEDHIESNRIEWFQPMEAAKEMASQWFRDIIAEASGKDLAAPVLGDLI